LSSDRILPDAPKHFQAIEAGQDKIEQHEIGLLATHGFQCLEPVLSHGYFESFALQQGAQEVDDVVHVFDDEDFWHGRLKVFKLLGFD
jgi:hypothetical protein